jgi:small subunit ribosomal protein S17
MAKTIVVETVMKKSHPLYRRVVAKSKKFYAHDENNTARVGDFVEIEETRPLSKLKRWRLKNVIQRAKLVTGEEAGAEQQAS